jgi:hypothetical protein
MLMAMATIPMTITYPHLHLWLLLHPWLPPDQQVVIPLNQQWQYLNSWLGVERTSFVQGQPLIKTESSNVDKPQMLQDSDNDDKVGGGDDDTYNNNMSTSSSVVSISSMVSTRSTGRSCPFFS